MEGGWTFRLSECAVCGVRRAVAATREPVSSERGNMHVAIGRFHPSRSALIRFFMGYQGMQFSVMIF